MKIRNLLTMHFNNKKLLSLLFIFVSIAIFAQNQVVVNAVVTPPYSTTLSDYIDNPNKLIVNFVNTTARDLEVYVQGKLTGDNGIEIRTDSSFKMSIPIILTTGVPYQLSPSNIEDVFSEPHLIYSGITKNEIIRLGGLPEGNYQFCFNVYEYYSGNLLSNQQANCSNSFSISFVDPPVILNPLCGSVVTKYVSQNVIISWTTPVGAPPTVRYRLVMVEMQPGNRNPADAIMSSSPATYFIEEDEIIIPQFTIDASQPPLIEGSSYAFYIKAYEPDNRIVFNNNGTSEICWFTYKKQEQVQQQTFNVSTTTNVLQDYLDEMVYLPSTKIQGRLFYKIASEAQMTGIRGGVQSMESEGENNLYNNQQNKKTTASVTHQTYTYGTSSGLSINKSENNNQNSYAWTVGNNYQYTNNKTTLVQNMQMNPPFGSGTINDGLYNMNGANALANMRVRLIPRVSLRQANGLFDTKSVYNGYSYPEQIDWNRYTFFDLNGNIVSTDKVRAMLDKPLAVATTDNHGNYSFDFRSDFFTGTLLIMPKNTMLTPNDLQTNYKNYAGIVSLKVEVLNEKFCSPDVEIFALPGDQLSIPDQVALLKDYDVDVHVFVKYDVGYQNHVSPHDTLPKALNGGEPIPNARVRVVRDYQKIKNEHQAVLLSEGNKKGKMIKNQFGEFKVIYEGKTDVKGDLKIKHLIKSWKLSGDGFGEPYYILIQTRNDSIKNGAENTLYNFKSYFGAMSLTSKVDGQWNNTKYYTNATFYVTGPVEYNHYYTQPPLMTASQGLKAVKPEIKGHLMAATNLENIGLKDIPVKLFIKFDAKSDPDIFATQNTSSDGDFDLTQTHRYYPELYKTALTNEAGFFRFANLKVKHSGLTPTGPYRRVQIGSDDQGNARIYKKIVWPPLNKEPYNLQYGDLKYIKFQLEPKQWLRGVVMNKKGESVPAYLRVLPNTPYVKTEKRWEYDKQGVSHSYERFRLPVADSNNEIEVVPLSNQYFQDTIHVGMMPKNNFIKIVVRKKMHRIVLRIKDLKFKKSIANASIIVGDTLFFGKTNSKGNILMEFASPGEQFTVKIKAEGYSPTQVVYNIPVSNVWTYAKEVFLSTGLTLHGTVSEQQSGQPIADALLFVELQNTNGDALYIETRTDTQGKYRLSGLPINLNQVDVHVVKEGKNPSYIGRIYQVKYDFRQTSLKKDFSLKTLNMDLSKIWGFPVVIESYKHKPGYGTSISGYLYNLPRTSNMQCKNADEKVYFNSIKIHGSASKIEPVNNSIQLKRNQISVKLNGGFTGKFANLSDESSSLVLKKKNQKAVINSALKIDLSSFNFAYDFHGNFYVGRDTLHSTFDLFNSKLSFYTAQERYYIFDIVRDNPSNISGYKVFGFNASSDFENSYYQNGKIHIGTTLHTEIPLPGQDLSLDLRIKAGDVIVSKEDMDLIPNTEGLNFDLEKWKIHSQGNWYFDKNRDAIILRKAKIQTKLGIEATINNLNIRPDALREGELNLSKGLTLGGVASLNIASGLKPIFNYDSGVGHYRISLTGTANGPAAWIDHLPALEGRLQFNSVDLLSNNTNEMSLGKTIRFHNLIDVFVDQVMSGDGFFSLSGMPTMHIPGWVSGQAVMTYYKEGNHTKFKIEPFGAKVDCNANTVYHLSKKKGDQKLQNKLFTAYGLFEIKPPAGSSGNPLKIKGYLVKKNGETYIDAIEQDVYMGKEKMHITEGRIAVTPFGNTWKELKYKAYTRSQGLDNRNAVAYVVHGGVEADSDAIKVDQIDTPFGNLSMAYLFDESALVGHLEITKPINLGYAGINNGMMETRFDPSGFYLGIVSNVTINGINFDGGLMIGYYGKSMDEANAKIFDRMKKIPPKMPVLHGLYFIGEKVVINKNLDLLVFEAGAEGRIGAYVGMDFVEAKVTGGGYGYLYVHGGVDLELCYIGVTSTTWVNMEVQYQNKKLSICNCGETQISTSACGKSVDASVLYKTRIDSSGSIDANISLSGSCPSQLCDDYDK